MEKLPPNAFGWSAGAFSNQKNPLKNGPATVDPPQDWHIPTPPNRGPHKPKRSPDSGIRAKLSCPHRNKTAVNPNVGASYQIQGVSTTETKVEGEKSGQKPVREGGTKKRSNVMGVLLWWGPDPFIREEDLGGSINGDAT